MRIKRAFKHNLPLPSYATDGAAAIDLYAAKTEMVYSATSCLIPTGWIFEIPPNYVGLIRDRSGMALAGLTTRAGVIDSDYRGEVKVLICNESSNVHQLHVGQRIAQMLIIPCEQHVLEEVDDLDSTLRGENGFGSTGVTWN